MGLCKGVLSYGYSFAAGAMSCPPPSRNQTTNPLSSLPALA